MDAGANGALREARIKQVEEHIRCENVHDIDALMKTFSAKPYYEDEPWNDHRIGRDAVRNYYEQLFRAAPDLSIEVRRWHVAHDALILKCHIRGTHRGSWHGLPPTERKVSFPLCAVYTFAEGAELAGERIYYDRATVLEQLGVLHDPVSPLGQAAMILTHPITIGRALVRRVLARYGFTRN